MQIMQCCCGIGSLYAVHSCWKQKLWSLVVGLRDQSEESHPQDLRQDLAPCVYPMGLSVFTSCVQVFVASLSKQQQEYMSSGSCIETVD